MPYELVDQHMIGHNLATGQDRLGDKVEVLEVENPRAFIAGRLIDAIEELDVANDKDFALHLAEQYITKLNRPDIEIGKLVHLYRGAIIDDIEDRLSSTCNNPRMSKCKSARTPYGSKIIPKRYC